MFDFIKKIFIRLLTSLVNASKHTKCIFISYHKCTTQPILTNLHPNEYNQGFCYYPFAFNLDRSAASYNTLNDLSNKVRVTSKTENLNLSVFNIIAGINKSKTLTKHMSCECKCKFDGRKCNSDQR